MFRHKSNDLYDLTISGNSDLLTTTGNHPFWSEERQAFVRADTLQIGERLRQTNGSIAIVASHLQRSGEEFVYNLEVDAEHVYFVGNDGILVHNDCQTYANQVLRRHPDGVVFRMDPIGGNQTGRLPGYPVSGRHGMGDTASGAYHYFHLKNGILRDPAHPKGIPVEQWLSKYADNLGLPANNLLKYVRFTPQL